MGLTPSVTQTDSHRCQEEVDLLENYVLAHGIGAAGLTTGLTYRRRLT